MNALEAFAELNKLTERVNAIHRIRAYLKDDPAFEEEVYVIGALQDELEYEMDKIADKLRTVKL